MTFPVCLSKGIKCWNGFINPDKETAGANVSHAPLQDNVDLGDLMFSLCYLPTAGRLTITMIKARNLKAMDITGASGN